MQLSHVKAQGFVIYYMYYIPSTIRINMTYTAKTIQKTIKFGLPKNAATFAVVAVLLGSFAGNLMITPAMADNGNGNSTTNNGNNPQTNLQQLKQQLKQDQSAYNQAMQQEQNATKQARQTLRQTSQQDE